MIMQSVVPGNKSLIKYIDENNFISNYFFFHLSRSDEATDDMTKVKRMDELMRNSTESISCLVAGNPKCNFTTKRP